MRTIEASCERFLSFGKPLIDSESHSPDEVAEPCAPGFHSTCESLKCMP